MKNVIKKVYYKFLPPELKRGYHLALGFLFHTERIYSTRIFEALLSFCQHYINITGKRPLCTVMSPTNRRLRAEMNKASFSQADFIRRLEELSDYADIGYHGHFWRSETDFDNPLSQIKEINYVQQDDGLIAQQFEQDYSWLSHQHFTIPYYAAGWWFMNTALLSKLFEGNIVADFSYTKLRWVSNTQCKSFLQGHHVRFGQPFRLSAHGAEITCIQTLMGCPNSPFSEDIIRQLNTYLEEYDSPMGMVATHDYNLIEGNNLKYNKEMISYLQDQKNVSMHSANELVALGSTATLYKI